MNLHDQIPLLGEIASLAAAIIWAGALCVFKGFGRGISASTLNLFKNSVALACLMLCLAVLQPQFSLELVGLGNACFFPGLSGLLWETRLSWPRWHVLVPSRQVHFSVFPLPPPL